MIGELPDQLFMNGQHVLDREQAPADPRLIRNDNARVSTRAQLVDRRPRPGQQADLGRIAQVMYLLDQRSIAIQKHCRSHAAPSPCVKSVEALVRALVPGGLLLYETFTRDQPVHGWGPRRPEFLLEPGELLRLFSDLEVVHHDEAPISEPRPEASARLVARRPVGLARDK